jgi:hypothetical protein
MQSEVELCKAAGIDVARMTPMDVFLLASRIISDPELTKKALALPRDCALMADGDRTFILNAMTVSERAALRDRVMGVLQAIRRK